MCILFTKTNPNPNSNEYYLVLANVRDEFYYRPTATLSFWTQHHIVGGKDMQRGREGGSWLAMNTTGKIGVLLNILQPKQELSPDKKSRGFLVINYLNNDKSPKNYLTEISNESEEYNGFRMIAIQIKSTEIESSVYSNFSNKVTELSSGFNVFGNNKIEDKLWPKVRAGNEKFQQIVEKYNKIESKEKLIESIFEFLFDKTKYPLDEQMRAQGSDKPISVLEKLNAIHVSIPEIQYGSRTLTIILIDSSLNVDYIEKTMKEPIHPNEDIQWITTEKKFQIS